MRAKPRLRPLAILMDRLPVHRSNQVKECCAELNITRIFNASYSPETNAIEAVFSKVKAMFCRRRTNCLVNRLGFNFDRELTASFSSISAAHCAACVRKSYFLL